MTRFVPSAKTGVSPAAPDLAATFRAEVLAARLEGALRADPDLAAVWRSAAAVVEACASAWLEDLPVAPVDLLCRPFEGMGDPDRDRAARAAASILRALHSPGEIGRDPQAALSRLWSLGAAGQGAAPFSAEDGAAARAALTTAESPILGAIAMARLVNRASGGGAPAVERLAFVAADHALRRTAWGRGGGVGRAAEAHEWIGAPRGLWVLQPAVALTDNGFRLWSVADDRRIGELIEGLTRGLAQAVGGLSLHRRWLDRADAAAGAARGRSALPKLVVLMKRRPILTGAEVRRALDLSERGALYAIDAAVDAGLLVKITPRASWRAWATAPFAALIGRG